jgi:dihydrofolate reductase
MARGGAIVGGRNTYEAADSWGGSIPFGIPFFIVAHNLEDAPPDDGFTFVNGLDEALARAREAAGDKDVFVMGGADLIRQGLRAGHVDELSISIAPVVIGGPALEGQANEVQGDDPSGSACNDAQTRPRFSAAQWERERDRRCENRTETRRHRPNGDLDRQRDHAGLRPLLPLALTMNDLFRREKLAHLPQAITTGGKRMSPIASGPS